jgi:hypothetical protein
VSGKSFASRSEEWGQYLAFFTYLAEEVWANDLIPRNLVSFSGKPKWKAQRVAHKLVRSIWNIVGVSFM